MLRVGFETPGKNPFSKRIAEHDEPRRFCHAFLEFDRNLRCDAHIRYGVRFNRRASDPAHCTIYTIDMTLDQEQVVREFLELETGAEYDILGVFRFKIGLFDADPMKWFCSELACAALQSVGVCGGIEPYTVTPNGLFMILDSRPWAKRLAV